MSEQNNNENLSANENNATITTDDPARNPVAGADTPEDTTGFEKVIERQNATIEALLKQVDSLNDQIARYVRNTSTPTNGTQDNTYVPPERDYDVSIKEDYVYLKDLGGEIGKR